MNSTRREIEVAPNSLKFNPSNNKKKKKKKKKNVKNKKMVEIHDESHLLVLFTIREMMMMMGYTSTRRVKHRFGLYLQVPTNQNLTCFICQLLTHQDDYNPDEDFPPYLLQHDYNNGFIYYQSNRTTTATNSSGTLLTYGLCIPNTRLVFAILVFVNAAGSKLFSRSITPLPHYLVDPNNTISTNSIGTALISTENPLSIISPPPPVNDDWFIFEILTRLPVKTLFRFKTVCKRWGSLIQKDQNFIDLHFLNRSRLPRLFIVNPVPRTPERRKKLRDYFEGMNYWDKGYDKESYITADLMLYQGDKDDTNTTNFVVVDTVREVDSTSYDSISNPVKGLICLIDQHRMYAVRICNISTRELSPLFESSLLSEEKDCYRMKNYRDAEPNYQLGFDPSTNEHKLVCLWKVTSRDFKQNYLICEVLTIGRQGINGDSRWRRIEEVPDISYRSLHEDSVYANGVIYWSSLHLYNGFWDSKYRPVCIVAFDVGREKFRTITVPDFILDQPGDDCDKEYNPLGSESYSTDRNELVYLLEVSGRLAMLVRMNNCTFKMYIYEDDDDYKMEEEINRTRIRSDGSLSNKNDGRWSEASSITLPFNLGKKCGVRFCKFVGSDDEIIITSSEGQNCDKEAGKKKCVYFYSYNWKKRSWREFEVSGIPSSVHLCTKSYVTTFSESLMPINNDKTLF